MGERKKFDRVFKEQVVLRILSGETTVSKMAQELGIHYSTIRDWVQNYKQDSQNAFSGSGNLKPEDEEIRKLQRQIADLKEEIGDNCDSKSLNNLQVFLSVSVFN